MKKNNLAVLAMSVISILWTPTFSITKELLQKLGPLSLIALRFALSALLLFIIRKFCRSSEKINPKDYKLFVLITVCCPLHYVFSNFASMQIDATESIVFSSFQCLITMLCASFLLGALITPRMSLCVGISAIGSVLTMNIEPLNLKSLFGYFCMFFATTAWVMYCVLMPKLLKRYQITTIIYYQSIMTAAIFMPALFFERNQWNQLNMSNILSLAFLAFLCISVCFILNAYGLKHIGPMPVSLFMNIGPVILLVLNVSAKNNDMSILKLIGIGMIILGITLTTLDIVRGDNTPLKQ